MRSVPTSVMSGVNVGEAEVLYVDGCCIYFGVLATGCYSLTDVVYMFTAFTHPNGFCTYVDGKVASSQKRHCFTLPTFTLPV